MGWDGSGNYNRSNGTYSGSTVWQQDEAAAVDIEADRHDIHDEDLAAGIEACLAKNGENSMTGDLDMGGNDISNLGGIASALTISNATGVDLTDGNNTLNVGPSTSSHLAMDGNDIQGKSNATTVGFLAIQRYGGNLTLGASTASTSGDVSLYHDGGEVLQTLANGVEVRSDTSTAELRIDAQTAGQDAVLALQEAGATSFRAIYDASSNFTRLDGIAGEALRISDLSGDVGAIFIANAGQQLNYADVKAFETRSNGVHVFAASGNTDGSIFVEDGNGNTALLQKVDNGVFRIINQDHGENVQLSAEDTGGTTRVGVDFDPDGGVTLNYTGSERLTTNSSGARIKVSGAEAIFDIESTGSNTDSNLRLLGNSNGGLSIAWDESASDGYIRQTDAAGAAQDQWVKFDQNGGVTSYFNDDPKARTVDESSSGTGFEAKDGNGDFQPVGFNVTPIDATTSNTDLRLSNAGHQLNCTSAVTIDMDTTTNSAPTGSVWMIANESGGNVSITATGVTLTWLDGAGGSTGTRTLGDGSFCTVTKRATGQYQVIGNGLT